MPNQDLSIIIPAKASGTFILHKVEVLLDYLQAHWQGEFEVVICVNGELGEVEKTHALLEAKFAHDQRVVLHQHLAPLGKGAALQSAFLKTQYSAIAFIDADLPFDLAFLSQAQEALGNGASLVVGNRRLASSRVHLPTKLLPSLFKRHVFGLLYNRAVRLMFGIKQSDTQCGIKLMTREFATRLFCHLTCHGFSYDVEMFLLAQGHGDKVTSIPVTLMHDHDQSTLHLGGELVRSVKSLLHLKHKQRRGEYEPRTPLTVIQNQRLQITSDDWGISPAVNEGMLKLAQLGVIKRVSIMANSLHKHYLLDELMAVQGIQLGLHFNLTNGELLGQTTGQHTAQGLGQTRPLLYLIKQSWFGCRKLSPALLNDIEVEFSLQVRALQQLGVALSYFDSHHHVHLLPGIIERIAAPAKALGVGHTRLVLDWGLLGKPQFLLCWFSLRAKGAVQRADLSYMPFKYPGRKQFILRNQWQKTLCKIHQPTEIICHPATHGDLQLLPAEYTDHYDGARVDEFWALYSLSR
ncbi:MAG: ChbG/HpnK family deacetylase [Oceanospirillaceae bacterium]|mgnify:FL=1|jgi:dolichyl-phosphate beta-glucosyltransferase|nr:ChbG/HpnK family deacetylase [Oceanospirillaceae bacterium]MBT4442737.1 ChbG/HpnK family deacetylase [Oceanospirillaceae bacterium]MBT6078022.1 ChbG/HpnK family deacetylase [Oceanospirillaceae bacterium]MBT7330233.1 ChbG/HpnK family deacetylase [Oceanospirillaceae bacterium]